jgi:hypothetical protein
VFKNISVAAPYLEVIEEMTAVEFLQFHNQFKQLIPVFDDRTNCKIASLQE